MVGSSDGSCACPSARPGRHRTREGALVVRGPLPRGGRWNGGRSLGRSRSESASRGLVDANPSIGGRALDVGTGFGDNAEELARRGMDVVAFDVAATAVARARARFPGSPVRYLVADLLDPPAHWRGTFDLVAETYTLQVLPARERGVAVQALRTLVAPGGTLLVIARGREPAEAEGAMPWPLTRGEVEAIAGDGLTLTTFEDFLDDEDPPVRRFRATFRRP